MNLQLHLDRRWHVGVVDAPVHRLAEPGFRPAVHWLPPPRFSRFLADPFAAEVRGECWAYAEAFDDGLRRGRIVRLEGSGVRWTVAGDAFAPTHHVSFPFLFVEDSVLYAMPEQLTTNAVTLYEVDPRTGRFAREVFRLDGFAGVDPVLFRHQGTYWLLATRPVGDRVDALHAFHAPRLEGPYRPHAGNPLVTGRAGVRNAGTPFVVGGVLHRPTQDGRRRYGHAVEIRQVRALEPTRFEETGCARVAPWDPVHTLGLHTLSGAGAITFVDGLRPSWVPDSLRRAAARVSGPVPRAAGAGPST